MEYEPTNRDRNREAARRRMRVTGRGLITIRERTEPRKATEKQLRQAKKEAARARRAA